MLSLAEVEKVQLVSRMEMIMIMTGLEIMIMIKIKMDDDDDGYDDDDDSCKRCERLKQREKMQRGLN